MNKYFNKIIISILAIFISLNFFSQDVKFVTEVGIKKAGISDRFYVTYKSNKNGQFIRPNFKNFTIVRGVSQGHNSAIDFISGTSVTEHTFQMIIQPKKLGKQTIEGAKIKIGNKIYESKSVSIEIVKESQAKPRPQRRSVFDDLFGSQPRRRQVPKEIDDKSFYTKIVVSKSSLYKNEHFVVSYNLYSKGIQFGLEKYDFPTQKNFWTENIKIPGDIRPKTETINGVVFQVFTFKKEVLFPQKSGSLKLSPFEVTCRLNQSFLSQGIQKIVKSNSPTITVKELPQNAPVSFENQVGNYKMTIDFKGDTVKIDQPIDLKITIKGSGNLKQMTELKTSFPDDFEVYDPETKERLSVSEGGISGSKTFNYLLIPRKSGKYVIEPIEFSYFDLKSKKYETVKSKTFNLLVLNEDGTINKEVNGEKDEGVKKVDKTEENKSSINWMYVLYPVLFLSLGALLFLFIKKRNNKEETEEDRRRNARKKLAKNLEIAKNHLDNNDISQFYDEILIGLNKYINDKLQIKTAEMNKENIVNKLEEKKVGESTISSFVRLIEQCEMAKYSSLSASNNHEIYERSLDVISGIEEEI